MRQLPYNQPQGNVFNYGKAVQDGQAIADNALMVREKSRMAQGQAASNALAQQGIQGQAKYDQLAQQGFGDIAKAEQTKDIARATEKNTYAKSQLEKVSGFDSFASMARTVHQAGAAMEQDTYEMFGVDPNDPNSFTEETMANINQYLGRDVGQSFETRTTPSGKKYQVEKTTGEESKSFQNEDKTGPLSATNVYSGSNPYMKQQAQDFFDNKEKIQPAIKSLKNLENMESLLDEGMITGSLANAQLGVGNFLKKIGIWDDKRNLLENTQSYFSTTAKETANIIKDFGAGTGLSDADREYALKAAGGDITMTAESLRNIIKINRMATINSIANWNQEVDIQPEQMLPNKNKFKVTIPAKYMDSINEYNSEWGYSGRTGGDWGYSKFKDGEEETDSPQIIEVDW